KHIDQLGLDATDVILDLLKEKPTFSAFANEKPINNGDNKYYYHDSDVMQILGGTTTYDKKSNTTTLSLTYDGKTANIYYDLNKVPKVDVYWWIFQVFSIPNSNVIIPGMGTATQNGNSLNVNVLLPIIYKNQKTYVNLNDLSNYFKKIWCDSSDNEKNPINRLIYPTPTVPTIQAPIPTTIDYRLLTVEQKKFIPVRLESQGDLQKTHLLVILNEVKDLFTCRSTAT
ncbi:MAG: hypothetical protein LBB91_00730, partial [Clostridiales bacterium]|nr:hypothetical protein [Clostridiales bacterium]